MRPAVTNYGPSISAPSTSLMACLPLLPPSASRALADPEREMRTNPQTMSSSDEGDSRALRRTQTMHPLWATCIGDFSGERALPFSFWPAAVSRSQFPVGGFRPPWASTTPTEAPITDLIPYQTTTLVSLSPVEHGRSLFPLNSQSTQMESFQMFQDGSPAIPDSSHAPFPMQIHAQPAHRCGKKPGPSLTCSRQPSCADALPACSMLHMKGYICRAIHYEKPGVAH